MPKSPSQPRLRAIVLYSHGHLGSAIVFNLLHKRELEIVGLVKASPWNSAKKGGFNLSPLKKTGIRLALMLAWQHAVKALAYGAVVVLSWFRKHEFLPGWLLAQRLKIPVFHCKNVNAPETLEFIREKQADIIISAYFPQIIRAPLLKTPKLGVLNIHPGWLPNYRGAMNYFWVVKNEEQTGGVSVHWMDETIDTGPLLARAKFSITPQMTQHQVLMKTAILGSRLLQQIVRRLARGEELKPIPISEEEARYFSMPDAEAFATYFKKRRFFRIRNIIYVFFRGIWRKR